MQTPWLLKTLAHCHHSGSGISLWKLASIPGWSEKKVAFSYSCCCPGVLPAQKLDTPMFEIGLPRSECPSYRGRAPVPASETLTVSRLPVEPRSCPCTSQWHPSSVLPRIKKWGDICPITFEKEGTFSKP